MDKVIRNKKNMKKHLSKNVQRENLFENCVKKKNIQFFCRFNCKIFLSTLNEIPNQQTHLRCN